MTRKDKDCGRCREWMMDILYSEDAERIPGDVEEHLRSCTECSEELEALRTTLQVIRKVDLRVQPPAGLAARIMSAIEAEAARKSGTRRAAGLVDAVRERMRGFFDATRPVLAHPAFAAAMIVLVVAGFLLLFKDFGLMRKPAGTTQEDRNLVVLPQLSPPEQAPSAEAAGQARQPGEGSLEKKAGAAGQAFRESADQDMAEKKREERAAAAQAGEPKEAAGGKKKAAHLESEEGGLTKLETKSPEGAPKKTEAKSKAPAKKYSAFDMLTVDDESKSNLDYKAKGKDTGGETSVELLTPPAEQTGAGDSFSAAPETGKTAAAEKSAKEKNEEAPAGTAAGTLSASTGQAAPLTAAKPATKAASAPAAESETAAAPSLGAGGAAGGSMGAAPPKKGKSITEADKEYAPAPAAPAEAPPAAKEEKKKGKWGGWFGKKKKSKEPAQAPAMEEKPAAKTGEMKEDKGLKKAQEQKKDPYVAARDAYTSGEYDDALAMLNSVLKDPSSSTASLAYVYHLLAKTWKKKGNNGKALLYYENLFARYPSYSYIDQARWEAALICIETGDTAQAKKLLEKLLKQPQYKDKAQKKLDSLK